MILIVQPLCTEEPVFVGMHYITHLDDLGFRSHCGSQIETSKGREVHNIQWVTAGSPGCPEPKGVKPSRN